MPWALRRKVLYGGVFGGVALVVLIWVGLSLFSKASSCFDNAQNQGELGVDCGGPCSRLCSTQTHEPIIEWQRSFLTASSTYTAVAYVQNLNSDAGAYGVKYAFRLYDKDNLFIAERDGVIDIPPQQKVPIIETNISTGKRLVAHTFLEFTGNILWNKIDSKNLSFIRIQNQQLSADGNRLSATVNNEGQTDVRNLTLAAVLFDASDNAEAASKSIIDRIPAGSSKTVVFTWSNGFEANSIVRAEILPLPALR